MIYDAKTIALQDIKQGNKSDIRGFLERNRKYLRGRVLDFGAGLCPYSDLCGKYVPYDPNYEQYNQVPAGPFDAVLCTQVLQFVRSPRQTIETIQRLAPGGYSVVTYPASWYEVQPGDTYRITKKGMERFLKGEILVHESISTIRFSDFLIHLVYGVVCRNPDQG